jgi:glycosyltransferase involved in cell wall biosynthesis
MALGIPTVATEVGTIYRIINHKENGLLVAENNSETWKFSLKELILNSNLRKIMGVKARETITEKYSISANKTKYLQVLGTD